ncbi:hypothetical protein HAX54_035994, partial [Datura stramonium]|nr:hypothetical protein [Datura stramonium]
MAISLRSGKELSVAPPSHEEDIVLPQVELEHVRKIVGMKITPNPTIPIEVKRCQNSNVYEDVAVVPESFIEFETVAFTKSENSRVLSKILQKLKDLWSFTLPKQIGESEVGQAR